MFTIEQLTKVIENSKVIVRVPAQKANNFYDSHIEVVDASKLLKELRKLDKKANSND